MNKLQEHFQKMQSIASRYLEPGEYRDLNGETYNYDKCGGKSNAFIDDILYLIDCHKQREAEAEAAFDYQAEALRTESTMFPLSESKYPEGNSDRLLHAAMGMATESGEFLDPLKKHLFYGKPLDLTNLKEEVGDLLWYIAIACDALDTTIDAEMQRNIAKLKARYPEKFTSEAANERNLTAERAILEGNPTGDSWVEERFQNERKAEKQFGPSC